MGDLLLLAITCVCRLHWSARRGSWSRVVRWSVDFIPMKFFVIVTFILDPRELRRPLPSCFAITGTAIRPQVGTDSAAEVRLSCRGRRLKAVRRVRDAGRAPRTGRRGGPA
eukprot:scaffold63462_cov52-Phaeocystis_antarctica.AAC.5